MIYQTEATVQTFMIPRGRIPLSLVALPLELQLLDNLSFFQAKMSNTIWFQPLKCEDLLLFLDFWFYKRSSLKQAAQICLVS